MTPNEIHEVMCETFRRFPLRNLKILHSNIRAPMLCGSKANYWIRTGGYG